VLSGRSRSNKLIHFEGDKEWIGKFVQVKVTAAQTWYVKAEVVSEPVAASYAG
jgi:tRNA-2-methylthio-N6-dimethylallyladenosine synthase